MPITSDQLLQRLASRFDQINESIGRTISWFTIAMVVLTFLIVVLRYLFNLGWIALQESVTYLHGMVFMLGAAYTLKHEGHVRVDIFYQKATLHTRAWVDLLGSIFLLMPMMLFILYSCWDYVSDSWTLLEDSAETGGLPAVFLLKSAIVLLPILMIMQGLAQAAHNALFLMGVETPTDNYQGPACADSETQQGDK
ncbi:MAG: TRAP transporter small permease subunit [Gammaproteobacteria bacterium]|nr:TRAP transporter small permease subunit [Gammaproteobacteria bacterium]